MKSKDKFSKKELRNFRLDIMLKKSEKQAFNDAASLAGIPLSAWIRERLRKTAIRELEEAALPIAFLNK